MSCSPSLFEPFPVAIDGAGELRRGVDSHRRPHMTVTTAEDLASEFSDDSLIHQPSPGARLHFSPALDTSISPTFSNFSPSTSSGYSIPSPDSVSTSSDPDDAWNLIPYNVSWGHEYEEYRAGILPGPEGDCIFLRSPTPLRNQRASEACKKCRERKAKCTGTRPSCARCASRDYHCEYASEASSESTSTAKARRSRRETREPARRDPVAPSPPSHSIKAEMPDFLSLQYTDHSSSYWEGSTPSDDCSVEEPWQFHGSLLADTNGHHLIGQPSIAAPHPVRHSDCNQLVAPPPTHGNAQAHTQIRLPMLPQFDMPPQHLAEHEVYMHHPEVKYEPSAAFGLHSYDPTVYHAGQDYGTSLHSLGVDYDAAGFPVHIPASKLGYNGHPPQYVNYLPSP
ncbi:hypothetical protein EDB83DRAFT_1992186 [Lactarius deliciosus]|nr:hypothetical protein EDB83DRAFT_1992186 [Lactarius deliciosus]